jgi:serine-protein kinase ATM
LWAAKHAKAEAIERDFFREAAVRMASAAVEEQARIFTRYARFADQLQRGLSTDAGDVAALRSASEYRRRELNELRRHSGAPFDKHVKRLEIEQEDDDRRLKEITVSRLEYLTTACRMYAQALAIADTQDDAALRLCALWLEHNGEDDFNGDIQTDLMKVPSWKFGTLIRQLTARLQQDGVEQSPFQTNLQAVLFKLCHDHPFHILYSLLTIAYPLRKASRRQSALGNPREQAALELLTKVKAGPRAKLISQMDMFSNAAIAWAEVPMEKGQRPKDHTMPPNAPLALQKDLMIPVPTADLPYDKTTGYKDIVTIRGYEAKFSIAGGISRPKIMACLGSDGSSHRELVRGDFLHCQYPLLT